jgi:hypothetical protein
LQATFWPGGRIPADGHIAFWGTADPAGAALELGLPPGEPAQLPTVLAAEPHARRTSRPGGRTGAGGDEDDETVWTASGLLAAFCDAVADSCARVASPTASVRAARTSVDGRKPDWRREWVAALSGGGLGSPSDAS